MLLFSIALKQAAQKCAYVEAKIMMGDSYLDGFIKIEGWAHDLVRSDLIKDGAPHFYVTDMSEDEETITMTIRRR